MPVYNTPEKWLVKVVDSVRAQTYSKWELCIADDASPHHPGDMKEGTLRAILRESGIDVNDFLKA